MYVSYTISHPVVAVNYTCKSKTTINMPFKIIAPTEKKSAPLKYL